jgi:hypothetical protein
VTVALSNTMQALWQLTACPSCVALLGFHTTWGARCGVLTDQTAGEIKLKVPAPPLAHFCRNQWLGVSHMQELAYPKDTTSLPLPPAARPCTAACTARTHKHAHVRSFLDRPKNEIM